MLFSTRAVAFVIAILIMTVTINASTTAVRSRKSSRNSNGSSHITVDPSTIVHTQQPSSEVKQAQEKLQAIKYILVRTMIGQALEEAKSKAIAKTRTPPPADGIYVNKPVLRGQFHKWGAILFPPLLGLPLCLKAWQCNDRNTSTITPNLLHTCLLFCFASELIMTISGTLHTYPWKTEKNHQLARKLDFMGIFVGMGCFYSSVGRLALGEHPLWNLIERIVWGCALFGTILKWMVPDTPRWVNASIFLVQGWTTLPVVPYMLFRVSWTTLISMLSGGLFVTLGALAYCFQWPYNKDNKQPYEIVFGPHEVFHVGTLLSMTSLWVAMWNRVTEVTTISP